MKQLRAGAFTACLLITASTVMGPAAHADTPLAIDESLLLIDTTWTATVTSPITGRQGKEPVVTHGQCSGWSVAEEDGSTYIITAGHCADPAEGIKAVKEVAFANFGDLLSDEEFANAPTSYIDPETRQDIHVGRQVSVIRNKDINKIDVKDATAAQVIDVIPVSDGDASLLRADFDKPEKLLKLSQEPLQVGQPITAAGYLGAANGQSAKGTVAALNLEGKLLQLTAPKRPYNVYFAAISAPVGPGMSGGPVVDEKGDVVGINSYMLTDSQVPRYMTDRSTLRRLLARNGIDESSTDPATAQVARYDSSRMLPWVVVGVTGMLFVKFLLLAIGAIRLARPEPIIGESVS